MKTLSVEFIAKTPDDINQADIHRFVKQLSEEQPLNDFLAAHEVKIEVKVRVKSEHEKCLLL